MVDILRHSIQLFACNDGHNFQILYSCVEEEGKPIKFEAKENLVENPIDWPLIEVTHHKGKCGSI